MSLYLCESCGRVEAAQTYIEEREITLPVKGEDVTLTTPVRVCTACGAPVFDRLLDNDTLLHAYAIYRDRHSYESPEQLRTLRERYGLSQKNLALLLGWSEATINRYEKGAVPDRAHILVLRTLDDPGAMESLLEAEGHRLSPIPREQLRGRVRDLIREATVSHVLVDLAKRAHKGPDLLTGYRPFSADKLIEMILFHAQDTIAGGIYETKLHKQMFYSDFAHFRETTLSISGEAYRRNPYGPTLHEYVFFDALVDRGDLECEQSFLDDGSPRGKKYKSLRPADLSAFSPKEFETMQRVYNKFASFSSEAISNISHQERAWLETPAGQLIQYKFAAELKAI